MNTSTISSKYQVVIPKEIRKKLNIKPGQKVSISQEKGGKVVINTNSVIDELFGKYPGYWGKDSDKYIRNLRNEWDEKLS